MKNNIVKSFFSLLVLLLISCTSTEIQKTTVVSDVYVSGAKANHACYWKNSVLMPLTDVGYTKSSADTLIVLNNDVHILGKGNNGVDKTLYWKNNIVSNLTDAFSTSTEIATICSMDVDSNNDVYFAGITQNISVTPNTYNLVYWKNGVKYIVDSFTSAPYSLIGLKVINNIIYITNARNSGGTIISGYYINGTYNPSNNFIWGVNSSPSGVYVYGRTSVDNFYKNITTNASTNLITNLSMMIPIYKMCFDGSDVYALNDLYVYKNGSIIYTAPPTSASYNYSRIENIDVKNNSIYLLNEQGGIGSVSQSVLKDGVLLMQNATDERFTSLFVN